MSKNKSVIAALAAMFGGFPNRAPEPKAPRPPPDPEKLSDAMARAADAKSYKERRKWECEVSKMMNRTWTVPK